MITKIMYGVAGAEMLLFVILIILADRFKKDAEAKKTGKFKAKIYSMLDMLNNLYVTIVSLFPLMGMLGTVKALLALDMAGDMEGLKNNFFQALDTTYVGIVCALIFKIIYAFIQHKVEEQMVKAKGMREELQ